MKFSELKSVEQVKNLPFYGSEILDEPTLDLDLIASTRWIIVYRKDASNFEVVEANKSLQHAYVLSLQNVPHNYLQGQAIDLTAASQPNVQGQVLAAYFLKASKEQKLQFEIVNSRMAILNFDY